jgi:rubredoxin
MCFSNSISTASRIRCQDCGWYFQEHDGLALMGLCFACLPFYDYPDPVAISCYHHPLPPSIDIEKQALEKALTRAELALYCLLDALETSQRSYNPHHELYSALRIFRENFPEFRDSGPYVHEYPQSCGHKKERAMM